MERSLTNAARLREPLQHLQYDRLRLVKISRGGMQQRGCQSRFDRMTRLGQSGGKMLQFGQPPLRPTQWGLPRPIDPAKHAIRVVTHGPAADGRFVLDRGGHCPCRSDKVNSRPSTDHRRLDSHRLTYWSIGWVAAPTTNTDI